MTYNDACDVILQDDGSYATQQLWPGDTRKIFTFSTNSSNGAGNIENELSTFNQHRLAVIRNKIERNLSIAIANYNKYSEATGIEFQMPELKETEWDLLMDNVAVMSFVQGLYIGGKIYNGYSVVNNSETKEVVQEENIYILGNTGFYYRIGDNNLTDNPSIIVSDRPAGRLNLDFKRNYIDVTLGSTTQTRYYYPLSNYKGSYSSIITQNNVTGYEDIYEYVANSNDKLKKAFYTALGRERYGAFKMANN